MLVDFSFSSLAFGAWLDFSIEKSGQSQPLAGKINCLGSLAFGGKAKQLIWRNCLKK
jgi:hypothetical protein